ncbi:MAG: MTAP family purine nucleoside phosphorylase [Bdellovibrionaceae bacterium]|nr:MTAP family purine nucleoside phosphorylase [Pseudobdellovibrionaceae bacterium]MBX3032300.1 MTAP family purine nucleoside phosphorylase [Pseudobdellovibrionaceae bacterium]
MLGIIGGSGFEKFDGFEALSLLDRETPFGLAASGFKKVRIEGRECLFLPRHGEHHEHLPSEVNYRANLFALKKAGAQAVVSFSAVGSLEKLCKPGDLVVPTQYIDRTKGIRAPSFFGDGLIGHVSLAHPVCDKMVRRTKEIIEQHLFDAHFDRTYVCVEGPYFSTKAESHSYRVLDAHIIGMTNFPEYGLAREAGLPYLPCCFVTDYDCWDDSIPHVTAGEVLRVMKDNNAKGFGLLRDLVKMGPHLWEHSTAPAGGIRSGLFMPWEAVPAEKRDWVEILLK